MLANYIYTNWQQYKAVLIREIQIYKMLKVPIVLLNLFCFAVGQNMNSLVTVLAATQSCS